MVPIKSKEIISSILIWKVIWQLAKINRAFFMTWGTTCYDITVYVKGSFGGNFCLCLIGRAVLVFFRKNKFHRV